ncbi:hypothetical protein OO007_00115 [Cocleimonas sp. KMM 6892]|uniref:hypothetical protein n=1 Tax=unclassified Cocleimonas TaxID=2639732 RepID=UPI002DBA34D8|nr:MULTISPECIES: hypothetical protein [unclassified Cocleimonas]MEB8430617.1 hypothetical protein [Cocleimonas sp. KMM 6892]MEC4716932.1 hypothetical protein [Cocleimonas sp. KMM 6895]MEC4743944.1 hypothetical protein [Cocleimonas sp. KMM 6896]
MLASYALDPDETLLLNLTETLLGRDYDQQTILYQNIGIKRRLSNLTFLYSEVVPGKSSLDCSSSSSSSSSSSPKIIQPSEPYLDMVVYGIVGSSIIGILPERISGMLRKGWSYSSRLELLWGAFSNLNEGAGGNSVACLPEISDQIEGNDDFGLSEALRPVGLKYQKIDGNLLLCNPAYCPFLIVEPGMSQQEFSHLECYLRNGGNLLISADNVIFEESVSAKDGSNAGITEDKKCLNFIINSKAL